MPTCQGFGCSKPEVVDPTRQCPGCKRKYYLCPACVVSVAVCPHDDALVDLVACVPTGVQCQGIGCSKPYIAEPTRQCSECKRKFSLCTACIITVDICPRDFAELTDVRPDPPPPGSVQCQGIDCTKPYVTEPTRQCPVCGIAYYFCDSCLGRGIGTAAMCLAHEVPVMLAPISGKVCQGIDCRKPIVPLPTRQCPLCLISYYLCRDCTWIECARHDELVPMTAVAELATPDEVWRSLAHICIVCGRGMGGVGLVQCTGCVAPSDLCSRCAICYVAKKGDVCKHCTKALVRKLESERLGGGTVHSCSSGTPPVSEEEPVEPPHTWIYFSNAPFDDFNSGDGSYIDALVQWINANGAGDRIHAVRLCAPGAMAKAGVAASDSHIAVDYAAGWPSPEPEKMSDRQEYYGAGQHELTRWMTEQKGRKPKDRHIFHLQSRFPDSGGVYNAAGLRALQEAGLKVVVTCHEMKYNFDSMENTQKTITQLNEYVAVADRVIFLNQHDLANALKLIDAGKLSVYIDAAFVRKREVYGSRYGVLNQRFDKLHAEYLKKPQVSKVHPSGLTVDDIVVPPEQRLCFFRIPGIATVPGGAIDPNAVLARPPNILIFGLIRNNTAKTQAVELAVALARKKPDSLLLRNAAVYVVGKVMKDEGMLEPITILAERKFSLLPRDRKTFKTKCIGLVGSTANARDFNAAVAHELDTIATAKAVALRENAIRLNAIAQLERDLQALIDDYKVLKERGEKENQTLNLEARKPIEKELNARRRAQSKMTVFDTVPVLPLEIELFVSDERFRALGLLCKYAYKVDQKGMADNASAIVSLVANGCIVFTEAGYDTPDEYRLDKGGDLSPVVTPQSKHEACEAAFVLDEIERRENESAQASNVRTLVNMIELLEKRYAIDVVGAKHLAVYATVE